MSRKGSLTDAAGDEPSDNPFAKLAGLRAALPEGQIAAPAAATGVNALSGGKPAAGVASKPKGPAKAVVRLERKGRGGKEATVVEQLGLTAGDLDVWLKALKTQLGCGGAVEGENLVLQGDLRKRIGPLLEARGVRKVILG